MPRRLLALAPFSLGVWLHATSSLLVATTMPEAVAEIGGAALINWAIVLYAAASIVTGIAAPVLAQRFGLRATVTAGAVVYGAGCIAAALAPDMPVLLAGRLAQGLGGGPMLPLSYIAIRRLFPQSLWTQLLALDAAVWSLSALTGPLIGGLFAAAGLWRGAFWAFAAQSLLLCALARNRLLPNDRGRVAAWPWQPLPALAGAVVLIASASLVAPAFAALLTLAGCAALALAARIDRHAAASLFPRETWQRHSEIGRGILMVFCLAAGTTGFTTYGPLLLHLHFGLGGLAAGYLLASESLAWTAGTLLVSGARRHRGLVIRAGGAIVLAGGVSLAIGMPAGSLPFAAAGILLQGLGFGFFWPHLMQRMIERAPEAERDLVTASLPTITRIGAALGAAMNGIAANEAGLTAADAGWAGVLIFASVLPLLVVGMGAAWRAGA